MRILTYVWLDAAGGLRSKDMVSDKSIPAQWSFDGSSTGQSEGHASDLLLDPVARYPNPLADQESGDEIILCQVLNPDGTPHPTNTYAALKAVADKYEDFVPQFGIEQEYYVFEAPAEVPFAPGARTPAQGPYYCGVGNRVQHREIADSHLARCMEAGIGIRGTNAEVGPGQWEFQIGTLDPIKAANDLWAARYLLHITCEMEDVQASFHPKPLVGDWNGSGCHTNYSTTDTRKGGRGKTGMQHMLKYIERLSKKHDLHIQNYGSGIEERLTGLHETCSYKEFKFGALDRGASVRIPVKCAQENKGYFEDRRPCANMDPYVVLRLILETTLGDE